MDFDHHHASPLLNSTYLYQQKSNDETRQFLLLTMELQETKLRAEADLKSRDAQILRLKELLAAAIKERDEAQRHCKQILFEKLLLHRHLSQSAPNSAVSSIEDAIDSASANASDCAESIASSPQRIPPPDDFPVAVNLPLPEKGKLLQAVVKAGPLLQTLLLAGPLPQWRHPPPPVDPCQIPTPPLALPTHFDDWAVRKRGPHDGSDWSNEPKRRRADVIC